MSRAGSSGTLRGAGFTLVEALVSLALLAIAAAIVGPSLHGSLRTHAAKSEAIALGNFVAAARTHAIATREETIVTFDTAANKYWSTHAPEPIDMQADTTMRITVATSERAGETQGGVRFFPDGTATGARLQIANGAAVTDIAVNWLTGRVMVDFAQ